MLESYGIDRGIVLLHQHPRLSVSDITVHLWHIYVQQTDIRIVVTSTTTAMYFTITTWKKLDNGGKIITICNLTSQMPGTSISRDIDSERININFGGCWMSFGKKLLSIRQSNCGTNLGSFSRSVDTRM
jgi:hypothetical protein